MSFLWNGSIKNSTLFETKRNDSKNVEGITISAGTGYSKRLGKFAETIIQNYSLKFTNEMSYYLLAEFELNNRFDLVAKFTYSPFTYKIRREYVIQDQILNFNLNFDFESFAVTSLLRYKPEYFVKNLFLQLGLGVWRWNPTLHDTRPRYMNNPLLESGIGYKLLLWDHLYFSPTVNWIITFVKSTGSAPRLQGYNQVDFAIMTGYRF